MCIDIVGMGGGGLGSGMSVAVVFVVQRADNLNGMSTRFAGSNDGDERWDYSVPVWWGPSDGGDVRVQLMCSCANGVFVIPLAARYST